MLSLIPAGRFDDLAAMLSREVETLARAGATVGLIASNTPHIVFEEIRTRSPIPVAPEIAPMQAPRYD
jgi:aspartate racemase